MLVEAMPPNKLKSRIWNYFTKIGDREAVCKICNKNLKTPGNTTNLRGHLDKVHSQQWENSEVPSKKTKRVITDFIGIDAATPETSVLNKVDLPSTSNSRVNGNSSTSSESVRGTQNSVASTSSSTVTHSFNKSAQPSVDDFISNIKSITAQDGAKSKKITDAIANFIIMDNRPFSTVKGKGFSQLMREVCPLYKMPSRETIKSRIHDKYEEMSNLFKTYIKNAENYCITYYIWTEPMQNKSFLGVTIHFLDKFKLLSGTLGIFEMTEGHRSVCITEKLKDIFEEWHISIDKVSAIITDNDSTVMKVNRDMFGEKKIIPCFAHTINIVVAKSIDDSKNCTDLINKVRDIVKFIKKNVNASDELRKRQTDMGLKEGQVKKMILDIRKRWNSCFYMLQRFIELVPIVGAILLT
ncbi:zinc finger BED domain-containing protein 4-like [Rhagoletis pomonella]|uniref:zinc finger BED domain-containing protein 4-like n=1 Tax=Rhagoletis pomonella TaxID=28610 RepID=UPI00177EA242|nr:zinc finger BED domain-containing protein 4-like [Rhagoletis pomonella]